jgi:hypothetical protein
LPDIATSLPLHHESNHPCQNLDHQQIRTYTKDPHQRPELAAIQFRAPTHVQSEVTFNQVERPPDDSARVAATDGRRWLSSARAVCAKQIRDGGTD